MNFSKYNFLSIAGILGFLPMFFLSSCIKEELPNIDADILEVISEQMDGVLNVVYLSQGVDIYVDPSRFESDNATFSINVSPGATISPDPHSISDYSTPQIFTVTSQDKLWEKNYTVRIVKAHMPLKFDFENWLQPEGEKYMIPYEEFQIGDNLVEKMHIWACGNEPYSFLTGKYDDYTSFPTQPSNENTVKGSKCAKLVTLLTGQYDKPVASGNLFIGQFDERQRDPLESTKFGLPFMKKPLKLTGYYHYTPGDCTYKTGVEDRCRIQGILYLTDANTKHLNGYTIKDSPNIVARAELSSGESTKGEFLRFELDFIYTGTIDESALASGKYNLAIVFSSSKNGDVYDGAPGSTMYIDDIEVVCE